MGVLLVFIGCIILLPKYNYIEGISPTMISTVFISVKSFEVSMGFEILDQQLVFCHSPRNE